MQVFNIGAIFVSISFQKRIVLHLQRIMDPHLNVDYPFILQVQTVWIVFSIAPATALSLEFEYWY